MEISDRVGSALKWEVAFHNLTPIELRMFEHLNNARRRLKHRKMLDEVWGNQDGVDLTWRQWYTYWIKTAAHPEAIGHGSWLAIRASLDNT